jgi:hypothetical protein
VRPRGVYTYEKRRGSANERAANEHFLQRVQWEHDRHYHAEVLGLSRYEQLRHYAFHLAKLAGAAAETASGDDERDFFACRLPDLVLFGPKLGTLTNEQLPTASSPSP